MQKNMKPHITQYNAVKYVVRQHTRPFSSTHPQMSSKQTGHSGCKQMPYNKNYKNT